MKNYMKIAVKEAEKGIMLKHGGPFGAVVVKDGIVIGKGHNRVLKNADPTCHGEVAAIRAACKKIGSHDLSGAVLYTTCYPCPMCLSAMMWANISQCYYGCTSEDADRIGFRDDNFYGKITDEGFLTVYNQEADRAAIADCKKLFDRYSSIDHTIY